MNLKELLERITDEVDTNQHVVIEDKDEGLMMEVYEVEFDRVNKRVKLVVGEYILIPEDD